MKLLILGGTVFLGRHLVRSAQARGHEVTLFNRGQRNADLFPELEKLRGDRDGDLATLSGRRWDAVIDTSGYVPRIVRASAELLAGAVDHYTFVSTVSVFAEMSRPGLDENAPVAVLADETVEAISGETYGALKALCEQAAEAAMPGRVLNVRPGLIVGPHDPSDRFTYWPWRVAQGGQMVAPKPQEAPVQFIDGRDLADWIIRLVEARQVGVYNATGPDYPLPMAELLETCRQVSGSDAEFVWLDEEFLLAQGVQPWMEMPLWIPGEEAVGMNQINVSKAIAAGLTFRPLADTVRDTIEWANGRGPNHTWRAGLPREREDELLAAYR